MGHYAIFCFVLFLYLLSWSGSNYWAIEKLFHCLLFLRGKSNFFSLLTYYNAGFMGALAYYISLRRVFVSEIFFFPINFVNHLAEIISRGRVNNIFSVELFKGGCSLRQLTGLTSTIRHLLCVHIPYKIYLSTVDNLSQ